MNKPVTISKEGWILLFAHDIGTYKRNESLFINKVSEKSQSYKYMSYLKLFSNGTLVVETPKKSNPLTNHEHHCSSDPTYLALTNTYFLTSRSSCVSYTDKNIIHICLKSIKHYVVSNITHTGLFLHNMKFGSCSITFDVYNKDGSNMEEGKMWIKVINHVILSIFDGIDCQNSIKLEWSSGTDN